MKNMVLMIMFFLSVWLPALFIVLAIAVPFKITIAMVVGFLLALYELIVRLIPTVTNISLLGKIIDFLKFLSEFLNHKK